MAVSNFPRSSLSKESPVRTRSPIVYPLDDVLHSIIGDKIEKTSIQILFNRTWDSVARLECSTLAGPLSPHFSPRVWKGGASAPPLQGLPDYSCVPYPAQSRRRRTARGTGPTKGGSRDFGGAEAPPFQQPP